MGQASGSGRVKVWRVVFCVLFPFLLFLFRQRGVAFSTSMSTTLYLDRLALLCRQSKPAPPIRVLFMHLSKQPCRLPSPHGSELDMDLPCSCAAAKKGKEPRTQTVRPLLRQERQGAKDPNGQTPPPPRTHHRCCPNDEGYMSDRGSVMSDARLSRSQ
jgi:hypothetical protein